MFGLDFDPKEFERYTGGGVGMDDDEYEEDDEDDELASVRLRQIDGRRRVFIFLLLQLYDDESGVGKRRRRARKAPSKPTSIYDVYEPDELERSHFTEKDNEIRVTDIPERFQVLCGVGVCVRVCVCH